MVFLGFGKYARGQDLRARADPRRRPRRGNGRWSGSTIAEAIVAPPYRADDPARRFRRRRRLEAPRRRARIAERIAEDAEKGRVDLGDLGRRARKLLEASSRPAEAEQLF
jgi:hypothetical protein